jgi:UDP-glucose 4-epimerase
LNKILVTGGAGFVGSNLVRHLNEVSDSEIVILDDFSTGLRSNLDDLKVSVVEGSICDPEAVRDAMRSCEGVVHLAALGSVPRSIADPMATNDANVNGTLNVLEAARTVGAKVVFSSSSSVYGANPQLPKVETMATMPMSPYAVSKLSGEQYVRAYGLCYDLKVLPFRFFNVFGPGQRADHQYAAVIPRFVDAVINGHPPVIYGDGTQSRDFTYVGDVAAILATALLTDVTSTDPVNLAFGGRYPLLQVVDMLAEHFGKPVMPRFEAPRRADVPHSQADGSRVKQLFPSIHPTPFVDGLRSTIEWFESRTNETTQCAG